MAYSDIKPDHHDYHFINSDTRSLQWQFVTSYPVAGML